MEENMSFKDRADLLHKTWVEYSARQRHHETLWHTSVIIFAATFSLSIAAVVGLPSLSGMVDDDGQTNKLLLLLVVSAIMFWLGLFINLTRQRQKAARAQFMANHIADQLSELPMFKAIFDLERYKKRRFILSPVIERLHNQARCSRRVKSAHNLLFPLTKKETDQALSIELPNQTAQKRIKAPKSRFSLLPWGEQV